MNILLRQMDIKVLLNKKLKGSITVEAALSFTLTIFILFMMLGPLFIIKTSSDLLTELNKISMVRANYEMLKRNFGIEESENEISEYFDDTDIKENNLGNATDIINYISFVGMYDNLYTEKDAVYRNIESVYDNTLDNYDEETGMVKYDYTIDFKLPYNVLHVKNPIERFVMYRRAFIGADANRFDRIGESSEYIYLASNFISSHIYHSSINCTYLIKKTYSYPYEQVIGEYSKCDYCFRGIELNNSTICYVTEYGDRFHYKDNCPVMTAYVTKATKDYIDRYDLHLCSRCLKEEMSDD